MPAPAITDSGQEANGHYVERPWTDRLSSSGTEAEADVEEEINEIARRITSSMSHGAGHHALFPKTADDALDPNSPTFDSRKWAASFFHTQTQALLGYAPNTAGLAFRNLDVFGLGTDADYQKTVGNMFLEATEYVQGLLGSRKQRRIDILKDIEGVTQSGEMLCVLGPPGSGCSTLLKTIAGNTYGFQVSKNATINYQGISPEVMHTSFRGEVVYTAEVDHHFPKLTVGETLYFAARARSPQNIPRGVSKHQYAEHLRDVVMAMLGISHTKNTRVGDDYIRGVSGGERKRVSIAEAVLNYSPWQCWDNSTRGLDSANAIEFCRTLRLQADIFGCTACVAIYQAPQEAYEIFDKVIVLYQGREIFFGKTTDAKAYFKGLGFQCPEQQTTPDFLTSMTSPSERTVQPGWKGKTPPRTPNEFAQAWKESAHRQHVISEIDQFEQKFPLGGEMHSKFQATRRAHQSRFQRASSPFTLSFSQQVKLNLWRGYKLLVGDPWMSITMLMTNFFESLIISSIFYNLPPDSSSFFKRNLLIFFSILINAMGSLLEILTLYGKRNVIDKHARYALYHPSAKAIAAMIIDLPYKTLNALCINIPIYFMCNLRREPGLFFFFFLISFLITLTMSTMFRFMGSVTKTVSQALAPSAIILLTLMLYSGFAIPQNYLDDWIGWLRWINPVFYAQESLVLSEFVGRSFPCVDFVPSGPGYGSIAPGEQACTAEGSVAGKALVSGSEHIRVVYGFENGHRWRNFGIILAMTVFFLVLHLMAVEWVPSERSKGEVLVFPRNKFKKRAWLMAHDVENANGEGLRATNGEPAPDTRPSSVEKGTSVFHWQDVCYEVNVKGETRKILDHVDGWVKPGTLTALMGVSGAGKTTLLDVLASRVTMGVISGQMLVDGQLRDSSFQRKTGYVTQQDLHLHTATVREALNFSALLRQPSRYTKQEKLAYVEEVIKLVGLEDCSDAVIGSLGQGLNVEQRKRLTIGVELAARPQLLLFLDEPTSGLDSQTSWTICDLMEKLTKNGQAILCTIHQPSAALFQRFDRLLLLAKGGRTVYFGDVGKNSHILIDYLTRNGAPKIKPDANPAEHMLEVIGATPKTKSGIDWPSVWRASPEYQAVQHELTRLGGSKDNSQGSADAADPSAFAEYAAGYLVQLLEVTKRALQQYWRTPSYIFSKVILTAGSALFIGLSQVNGENTERGLQNQMFGVYIFLFIFSQVVEQMMPMFVTQRLLYEARERPAKAYAWPAFLLGNVIVEIAWNSLMAVFSFIFWYFPMGLYRNAEWTDAVHSRGIATMLHVWGFLVFSSTFANMLIAGVSTAEIAGGLLNLFFVLMFAFCGVLAGPSDLPGFWIFMYRVNPFTYVVEGFLATSLANAPAKCMPNELVVFSAPYDTTCREYMGAYIQDNGGYVLNSDSSSCEYCPLADTNAFLANMNMSFGNRWSDFGFVWAYCIFNVAAAAGLYWLVRVPKNGFNTKKTACKAG